MSSSSSSSSSFAGRVFEKLSGPKHPVDEEYLRLVVNGKSLFNFYIWQARQDQPFSPEKFAASPVFADAGRRTVFFDARCIPEQAGILLPMENQLALANVMFEYYSARSDVYENVVFFCYLGTNRSVFLSLFFVVSVLAKESNPKRIELAWSRGEKTQETQIYKWKYAGTSESILGFVLRSLAPIRRDRETFTFIPKYLKEEGVGSKTWTELHRRALEEDPHDYWKLWGGHVSSKTILRGIEAAWLSKMQDLEEGDVWRRQGWIGNAMPPRVTKREKELRRKKPRIEEEDPMEDLMFTVDPTSEALFVIS